MSREVWKSIQGNHFYFITSIEESFEKRMYLWDNCANNFHLYDDYTTSPVQNILYGLFSAHSNFMYKGAFHYLIYT